PIAAPSANVSGRISPTLASHVAEEFGETVDLILDDGAATLGLESTVIGFDGEKPVLLRPGAMAREDIEKVAGPLATPSAKITSPGQLINHYAPRAALRLNANDVKSGEALLAFGAQVPEGARVTSNLSATG